MRGAIGRTALAMKKKLERKIEKRKRKGLAN